MSRPTVLRSPALRASTAASVRTFSLTTWAARRDQLVHRASSHTNVAVFNFHAEQRLLLLIDAQVEQGIGKLEHCYFDGCRRTEPAAARHIAGDSQVEALQFVALFAQNPQD